MKTYYKKIKIIIFIIQSTLILSCSKNDFLDKKPDDSLVVPETLADFQALLDNDSWMNGSSLLGVGGPNPSMGEVSSDNLYITDIQFPLFSIFHQNVYTWQKEIYEQGPIYDWNNCYRTVFYSNVVLDGIQNLSVNESEMEVYNNIKGSALFFRAHTFYQLAQVFAPPYDEASASMQLGIPLRLTSDINVPSTRANLQETYDQIVNDLKDVISLLPTNPPVKTRPSKPAAYALLARVYQTMERYEDALMYADSCLALKDDLLDYQNLSLSTYPIPQFNDEVIFQSLGQHLPSRYLTQGRIDTTLYDLYEESDLRKTLFFVLQSDGRMRFRGSYNGTNMTFSGIATDEIYLIKAECLARRGDNTNAIAVLNRLLQNRYTTENFVPLVVGNGDETLKVILDERRKELIMRGLRWTDLRRLNKDSRWSKTLTRIVNGETFSLPPNDPRYTLPIPNDVIALTGMEQNAR